MSLMPGCGDIISLLLGESWRDRVGQMSASADLETSSATAHSGRMRLVICSAATTMIALRRLQHFGTEAGWR